jgi:hypothetical protein
MGDDAWIDLDPEPLRIDASWGFGFVHSDGAEDHVNGFLSEEEAAQWIHNGGLEAWARNKKYAVRKQKQKK